MFEKLRETIESLIHDFKLKIPTELKKLESEVDLIYNNAQAEINSVRGTYSTEVEKLQRDFAAIENDVKLSDMEKITKLKENQEAIRKLEQECWEWLLK